MYEIGVILMFISKIFFEKNIHNLSYALQSFLPHDETFLKEDRPVLTDDPVFPKFQFFR